MNTLDSAERVHYAMLAGEIPRITMMQCAHTWGAQVVMELTRANELRADLENVSNTLLDFNGETPLKQAQAAMEKIDWLEQELKISKKNEWAVRQVLQDEQRQMILMRNTLTRVMMHMRRTDPHMADIIFGESTAEPLRHA